VRVLLLHNPTAGNDRMPKEDLVNLLSRAGCEVDYLPSDDPGLGERLSDPVDLVAIAGGDGTVAKVLTQMCGAKGAPLSPPPGRTKEGSALQAAPSRDATPLRSVHPRAGGDGAADLSPLGGKARSAKGAPLTAAVTILPMGTANNLARALGIRAPVADLIEGLRNGRIVPLDVGETEGPWGRQRFFESAGFGAIARALGPVNESRVPSREKIPQGRKAMREVFKDMPPARLEVILDDCRLEDDLLMLELSKIASLGPQLCLAPQADPGDGLLHVCALPAARREEMLAWLDDPEGGGAAPMVVHTSREVKVTWRDTPSHLDDFFHEPARQPQVMRAWLEPSAVKILVPGKRTG